MAIQFHNFPSCCGAGILTSFWNRKQTPSGWENLEALEKDLDTHLKRVGTLAFIPVILNYMEYEQEGVEELLFSRGFKLIGEEVNYSPKPIRFYLRERNWKRKLEKELAEEAPKPKKAPRKKKAA